MAETGNTCMVHRQVVETRGNYGELEETVIIAAVNRTSFIVPQFPDILPFEM